MPPYLMGADVGTTNCKVTLIDSVGHVLANSQSGHDTHYPREGWAEQNPEDWYRAVVHGIRHCIKAAEVPAQDIVALSVCGPAHNVVLLGQEGCVLQPLIIELDRRYANEKRRASWKLMV